MHPMLNIAIRAVRKGGDIILQNYDTQNFIEENINKKNTFITNIICKTHRIMKEIIYKSYPHHVVFNKNENILLNNNEKKIIWIINELDGKNNFIKNFPHFCVSIMILIQNKTEISVIYDPIKNDLFTSVKGQGSQLNGYRIRCSNIKTLNYSTIAINLPNYLHNTSSSYFKIYQNLIACGVSFRFTGSTLLDLAYVAAGRIDCLFNFNVESNNFTAGKLQVQEAGCLISNFTGEENECNYSSENLISSPKFIRLITDEIRKYL